MSVDPKIISEQMEHDVDTLKQADSELAVSLGLTIQQRVLLQVVKAQMSHAINCAVSGIVPFDKRLDAGEFLLQSSLATLRCARKIEDLVGNEAALAAADEGMVKSLSELKGTPNQ